MVAEEMLCVPKLVHVPLPTCMLRVVNNDTGEEIPRVFQKVAPYVYKRNKVCARNLICSSAGYRQYESIRILKLRK